MKNLRAITVEALSLVNEIRKHPDYKALDLHADVTIGDCHTGLREILFNLGAEDAITSSNRVNRKAQTIQTQE